MSLVAELAALTLLPENLPYLIRIESAIHLATATARVRNGRAPFTRATLLNALEQAPDLQSLRHLEDPPEGFFTEAVSFIGGTYVVYPGLAPEGSHAPQVLLRAVFLRQRSVLPREVEQTLIPELLALLAVSNEVARRAKHARWTNGAVEPAETVTVPTRARLSELTRVVTFSGTELAQVLSAVGVAPSHLATFYAHRSEWPTDLAPGGGPLLRTPMLQTTGNGCILALPTGVATAIQSRIFEIAEKLGLLADVVAAFHEASAHQLIDCLARLGFRRSHIQLSDWPDKPACVSELLLTFDAARPCYVQLVTDACPNENDDGRALDEEHSIALDKRRSDVLEHLCATPPPSARPGAVLALIVLGPTGRPIHVGANCPPPPHQLVLMSHENLCVIANLRNVDAIGLWHFASAYARLKQRARVQYWTFLDLFAFYRSSHESFYATDDLPPNFIAITSDYGRELRHEAARRADPHAAQSATGGFTEVVCRFDTDIPIYIDASASRPTFLLETNAPPLWLAPSEALSPRADLRTTSVYLAEAITYWMWQVGITSPDTLRRLLPGPTLLEVGIWPPEGG